MKEPAGTLLLVFLLLAAYGFSLSRGCHRHDGPPAFFIEDFQKITVELGRGFQNPGIHQFSDGTSLSSVIRMTNRPLGLIDAGKHSPRTPLRDGQRFDFSVKDSGKQMLTISWMRAAKRMALGVPLHPDHMGAHDWQDLPGIGPRLAEIIELDRQENGDFGGVEHLRRVRGIGEKRISAWGKMFGVN